MNNMKRLLLTLALLALAATPLFALAGPGDVPAGFELDDTLVGGPTEVLVIINTVIDWIFTIVLIISVIIMLIAAFKYLTGGSNEENIQTAHRMLLWAVVGIAVALLAQAMITLVRELVLEEDGEADTFEEF